MSGLLTILAHSNHVQFSTAGTSLNRTYKDVQIAETSQVQVHRRGLSSLDKPQVIWGINIEVIENKLPWDTVRYKSQLIFLYICHQFFFIRTSRIVLSSVRALK